MMPAPVSLSAVESVATVEPVPPSVITIRRGDDDPNHSRSGI